MKILNLGTPSGGVQRFKFFSAPPNLLPFYQCSIFIAFSGSRDQGESVDTCFIYQNFFSGACGALENFGFSRTNLGTPHRWKFPISAPPIPREKGYVSEPRKVSNSVPIIDFPSRLIFRDIFRIYFPTSILYFSEFDFSIFFEFGNSRRPDFWKIEVGNMNSPYRLSKTLYRVWTHFFLGKYKKNRDPSFTKSLSETWILRTDYRKLCTEYGHTFFSENKKPRIQNRIPSF